MRRVEIKSRPVCLILPRSSARQAVNHIRNSSERAHLYRKLQEDGQYYFELYNEQEQLLLVSERYWSEDSRDYAMNFLKRKGGDAEYIETI